jgi:hypothetical protein
MTRGTNIPFMNTFLVMQIQFMNEYVGALGVFLVSIVHQIGSVSKLLSHVLFVKIYHLN